MSNVTIDASQGELATRYSKDSHLVELVEVLDAASTDICVSCGKILGGFFGTFRWGIANGYGECSECGFPYVYYHRHEVQPAAYYEGREVAPARELVLMAYVPNAEMPLAALTGKATD